MSLLLLFVRLAHLQVQPTVYFEGMDPAKEQASLYMDQVNAKQVRAHAVWGPFSAMRAAARGVTGEGQVQARGANPCGGAS